MAQNNALNKKSFPLKVSSLTVDPGASGDSYVQFNINTTGEFRIGVDDSDSDSFKISSGSALGTNDYWVMSASGERTMPNCPAFIATLNSEVSATGDGTVHYFGSIAAVTEVADRGSDFTVGDGAGTGATFTAPVTGKYFLSQDVQMFFDTTGGTTWEMNIATSNRTYTLLKMPTARSVTNFYGSATGYLMFGIQCLADMDSADTAQFSITSLNGAKDDDVVSGNIGGFLWT